MRIVVLALALLAATPAVLGALYIRRFAVNVPCCDQWLFVSDLDRWYGRTWTPLDLLRPQGPHVLVLPRVLMLALAVMTRYNTFAESTTSWLFLVVSAVVVYRIARRVTMSRLSALAAAAGGAWLLFSPRQEAVYLFGMQLCSVLSVTCVYVAAQLLTRPERGRWRIGGAWACALAAALSFFSGVMAWPAIGVMLVWPKVTGRRLVAAAAFVVAGVLVTGMIFLAGATWTISDHPAAPPPNSDLLRALVTIDRGRLETMLLLLGSPLTPFADSALYLGMVVAAMQVVGVAVTARGPLRRVTAGAVGLIAYAWLQAFLGTILARGEAVMASRYATLTVPGMVGLLLIAAAPLTARLPRLALRTGIAVLVVAGVLIGYPWGWDYGAGWRVGAELSAQAIHDYRALPDDVLEVQMPGYTAYLRRQIAVLERYRLSVFADR
jgi:hypothetical protein